MDDGNITLVDQTDTEKCKGETQGMDLRGGGNSEWAGQEPGGKLKDKFHSKSERGYI